MENDLVRYSRAGDAFHYRWAAKRCLKLLYPQTPFKSIKIEGSKESDRAGEYVIDVSEYYEYNSNDKEIKYYQLKHTTVRNDVPFKLSALKDTIIGFANRYRDLFYKNRKVPKETRINFIIITNRQIDKKFKKNIESISNWTKKEIQTESFSDKRFLNTIKKYTQLEGKHLIHFCKLLIFNDSEGSYKDQKIELIYELSKIKTGLVENSEIANLTDLIYSKALPDNNTPIEKVDILKLFGINSDRDLFPAPPKFDTTSEIIKRSHFDIILKQIFNSNENSIIHAGGGVGKSIFASHLQNSINKSSVALSYDCFGGGDYKNRSSSRHLHKTAFVQIANELSLHNLCDPFLIGERSTESDVMRKFLSHLDKSVNQLRQIDKDAILLIIIDAADNAEMAAAEYNEYSFANELLNEKMPDGCKLVCLCRTERINLLKPSKRILKLELPDFSIEESTEHLKIYFPDTTKEEGEEFHRLSGGNPRVQINAIKSNSCKFDILTNLGPDGLTAEQQISELVENVKEKFSSEIKKKIDDICTGLATLPPLIPINILANVADVSVEDVKSFISDLGHPLWLTDQSVQFRDEPTETWFRNQFSASTEKINSYLNKMAPFADKFSYVAETIPILMLQAGQYDELIKLALSNELLPSENPFEKRNIKLYRLKFAFKAALIKRNFPDAIQLAFLAGEETAGEQRQNNLLIDNFDILSKLRSKNSLQELAFRRTFKDTWEGSENIFTASLLSFNSDFHGEARSFLKSAEKWLDLHIDELKTNENYTVRDSLNYSSFLNFLMTYYNIEGVGSTYKFLKRFRTENDKLFYTQEFIDKIIELGNTKIINELYEVAKEDIIVAFAICEKSLIYGKLINKNALRFTLNLIIKSFPKIDLFNNHETRKNYSSFISFLEACFVQGCSKQKIKQILNKYFTVRSDGLPTDYFDHEYRNWYIRSIILRTKVTNSKLPKLNKILPENFEENYSDKSKDYKTEFEEVIFSLIPYFDLRIRSVNGKLNLIDELENAQKLSSKFLNRRYRNHDFLNNEIKEIIFQIISFNDLNTKTNLSKLYNKYFLKDRTPIKDLLLYTKISYHNDHLICIAEKFEEQCYKLIRSANEERIEDKTKWLINLSRAVFLNCPSDSSIYFNEAIESVSKFGDEVVERWQAVSSLAKAYNINNSYSQLRAFRYLRSAELVGQTVSEKKYWDRNEAIKIACQLSPQATIAYLSRWRDRDIGFIEDQTSTLLENFVLENILSPMYAWSLSPLLNNSYIKKSLAFVCITKEVNKKNKEFILNDLQQQIVKNELDYDLIYKIKNFACDQNLNSFELNHLLQDYKANNNSNYDSYSFNLDQETIQNLELELSQFDLSDKYEINNILEIYVKYQNFGSKKEFWKVLFEKIPLNHSFDLLRDLSISDELDIFDLKILFKQVPQKFKNKVSFKRNFNQIILAIGKKNAKYLCNISNLDYFIKDIENQFKGIIDRENLLSNLHEGIFQGILSTTNQLYSNNYFEFIEIASNFVDNEVSEELLDFSLSRFEEYMPSDFSDGNWNKNLIAPQEIDTAVASYLWVGLGSPNSDIRWYSIHSIINLAQINQENTINNLVDLLKKDSASAFRSTNLPFYLFDAKLYSLIALSCISVDYPKLLIDHKDVFKKTALGNFPHILIKIFAAQTALNIYKFNSECFSSNEYKLLSQVGKSNFPFVDRDKLNINLNKIRKVDSEQLEFYHNWDLQQYWFSPLGRVFGISSKSIEDMANYIIFKEWNFQFNGSYNDDPRSYQWQNNRDTHHSHGSFPKTSTLNFYISFHSLFAVADELLNSFPIVFEKDFQLDRWTDWIKSFLLSRNDCKLLSERRDPIPKETLINNFSTDEDLINNIPTNEQFKNILIHRNNNEIWINCSGYWKEGKDYSYSIISTSSAFVEPEATTSLIEALKNTSPYDFYIPDYIQDVENINSIFNFEGWIEKDSIDFGIDRHDPQSGELSYPPKILGERFSKLMSVKMDKDNRIGYCTGNNQAVLKSLIWNSKQQNYGHEQDRQFYGNKFMVKLDFLKKLCRRIKKDLIIDIEISVYKKNSYYSKDKNKAVEYPIHKLFIISKDGEIRDENGCI